MGDTSDGSHATYSVWIAGAPSHHLLASMDDVRAGQGPADDARTRTSILVRLHLRHQLARPHQSPQKAGGLFRGVRFDN